MCVVTGHRNHPVGSEENKSLRQLKTLFIIKDYFPLTTFLHGSFVLRFFEIKILWKLTAPGVLLCLSG